MAEPYTTSIEIAAPADVVFEHLTRAEAMLTWMGQHAVLEPVPGGAFEVDINGSPVRGRYVEVEPPHRVVVSWGVAGSDVLPAGSSTVEFVLTPTTDGTLLELTHKDLPEPEVPKHGDGWTYYLARLQNAAMT